MAHFVYNVVTLCWGGEHWPFSTSHASPRGQLFYYHPEVYGYDLRGLRPFVEYIVIQSSL